MRIVKSYFQNRILQCDTEGRVKEYKVTDRWSTTCGSVFDLVLWNILYDGILRIPRKEGVDIIGYADDLAVVVVAKDMETLTAACNETISTSKRWLQFNQLEYQQYNLS